MVCGLMANDGLSGCGPRNIYVDFGASWCNTLLLHTKLEEARKRTGPWLVYAFEAAPLIAPYVESCAAELTAGRLIPAAPVPPTGSSTEFVKYVKAHDKLKICYEVDERKVKKCVFSLPEMVRNMSQLSAHPWLGSRETVSARLAAARHACPKRASTFTAIHAAASDGKKMVRMSGGIEQLMVGGSKPFGMNGLYAHNQSIGGKAHETVWDVLAFDTARWIQQSVRPEDFFVLKMDIEGFEHKVIPAMLKANLTGLIDVFAWECHYGIPGSTCHSLHAAAFGMPGFLPTEAVYSESRGSGNFRKIDKIERLKIQRYSLMFANEGVEVRAKRGV